MNLQRVVEDHEERQNTRDYQKEDGVDGSKGDSELELQLDQ
jgi:hypothetical protein